MYTGHTVHVHAALSDRQQPGGAARSPSAAVGRDEQLAVAAVRGDPDRRRQPGDAGFNQRLFGVNNNPTCPAETSNFVPGRNYWHDANNVFDNFTFAQDNPAPPRGNRLKFLEDPRYVTLFFTPYDSFTSSGNETFPIVGFGGFYVTGYGRTTGGGGNVAGRRSRGSVHGGQQRMSPFDGMPFGVGNEPPPISTSAQNQTWVVGPLHHAGVPDEQRIAHRQPLQPAVAGLASPSWSNSQWAVPSEADDVLLQCRTSCNPSLCRHRSSTERT